MPIYEFYCPDCHMIYSFLSARINTSKIPACPKCPRQKLERQISLFAITGKSESNEDDGDLPIDESRMEQAMHMLTKEAEHINEDDPRQAAQLMRKLTDMTGMELGQGMQEALGRMEQGEDPESVEADLGDILENEEPFLMSANKSADRKTTRKAEPGRDDTLYDL